MSLCPLILAAYWTILSSQPYSDPSQNPTGATVTGLPSVAVTDGGKAIWELRREESAEGINLVLWGRPRGMVMTIK